MKTSPVILFFKSHIETYTKKNGSVVRAHDDTRQPSLFDHLPAGGSASSSMDKTANADGVPMFETYSDAQDWMKKRSLENGGIKRFSSTKEYASAYQKVKELYDVEHASKSKDAMDQLRDSGMKAGDKVTTTFIGAFFSITKLSGVITIRSSIPYVKLTEKITVSKGGKLYESGSMRWDKRWKPE